jgi:hypothetical protein
MRSFSLVFVLVLFAYGVGDLYAQDAPATASACVCQHHSFAFVTETSTPLTSPTSPVAEADASSDYKGGATPGNPQPQRTGNVQVDAFPNPTSGPVSFTLPPYTGGDVRVTVYNSAGQEVYAGNANSSGGPSPTISLDISFMPTGLYTFRLANGAFSGVTRVVIR